MCGDQPPEPPAHGQALGPIDQLIGHSAVFESRVDAEAAEGEAVVFTLDDDVPRDLAVDLADEDVGAVEQFQKLRGVVALRMPAAAARGCSVSSARSRSILRSVSRTVRISHSARSMVASRDGETAKSGTSRAP